MAGRLGIDFGTSNTVVAAWDEATGQATTLHIPDYGRYFGGGNGGGEPVPVVPSVIHYAEGGRRLVGDQVLAANLYDAAGTFRWMKRYIANRSPVRMAAGGRRLSHFAAGRDYLAAVLGSAALEAAAAGEEVALTAPVESFEHYEDWLAEAAEAAGLPRFRLLDEPSAAALGYGAHLRPGNVYLVFDFGGGTVQAAVVRVQDDDDHTGTGRACRVLGKAGDDIGGATVDQWIFEELLARNGRDDSAGEVRRVSRALLVECERAKEALSDPARDHAEVSVVNPATGTVLGIDLVRSGGDGGRTVGFEELLDRRELFARVDRVVRRALRAAAGRGYDENDLAAVLMVGGSSLIPSVRRTLERIFGRDRVLSDRPLDAVARGAAAYAAGAGFHDHVQHDYAVRWFDRESGRYEYRVCVRAGTAYPTAEPVDTMTVRATGDGQRELGIAIYELGGRRGGGADTELVCDPSGAWRVRALSPDEEDGRNRFWINEGNPMFLEADPPATAGQARFRMEFGVDGNKRLLLTARDLVTGRVTHRDHPVVKLT
ncbi:Hsp70 family protein [Actinomadura chibensis]|uniref:Hsp70 family protein n=1 Tax=Actinomadura chibensis TaxID=392828 RepID=A0A5D0NMS6_9ACTN|nr:Hsp70 family protein [Actinomadura chibensis]TYB45424.1 Hsp70 family protein [Actinomadura chibensis]